MSKDGAKKMLASIMHTMPGRAPSNARCVEEYAQIADNNVTGNVQLSFPNGDTFEGKMRDGLAHGLGKYTWKDGRVYEGKLKDGQAHGPGCFSWPNGESYEGGWKDGKADGLGTFSWPDTSPFVAYKGEYNGGVPGGLGTCQWSEPNPKVYRGERNVVTGAKEGIGAQS